CNDLSTNAPASTAGGKDAPVPPRKDCPRAPCVRNQGATLAVTRHHKFVSNLEQSSAVAQAIRSHVDALQHGQQKVRDGSVLPVVDVPASPQGPVSRADDEHGQPVVRVAV